MPIYAYKCESCGHSKDVLQKMSDALLTVCPQCDASSFKKQLTSAGFQLKGSGWYVTDFRGGAGAAAGSGVESAPVDSSNKSGETTATPAAASGAAPAAPATSASVTASATPAPAASSTATPVKSSA